MSVRVALMSANSKACIKTVLPLITIYVRNTIYCSKSYINAIHEITKMTAQFMNLPAKIIQSITEFIDNNIQGVSVKVIFSPSMSQGLNLIKYW